MKRPENSGQYSAADIYGLEPKKAAALYVPIRRPFMTCSRERKAKRCTKRMATSMTLPKSR
jgi:hypothetical protein